MTLHELMDPIYDPADTREDADDDALGAPWEPIDMIGGEGGGE